MKLEGHRHNRRLVLTPTTYAALLLRIARHRDTPGAPELFVRLASTWGARPDRSYITFRPTTNEKRILKYLGGVVSSPTATRHKESTIMAKTKAKAKTDDIDELEAELEGLEEIEEEDEDAPDIEEEDDDEEGDDDPDLSTMTAAQLKALCKTRGIKGSDKKNKAALIAMLEAAGEDEEEDDEEEEDEEASDPYADLTRAEIKALLKEHGLPNANKSESDDDLRARLPEAEDDEEEDEDEEGEEDEADEYEDMDRSSLKAAIKGFDKAAKFMRSQSDDDLRVIVRAHATKPAKGKKGPNPKGKQPSQLTRKLPAGRKSAADVANMAGTSALNIRNHLRTDAGKKAFPKDAELGRYSFTDKQAKALVTSYKKGARNNTK